ncbi:MAG: DEAD/DEAH box helicase [Candidatus Methanomethylicia archaeon]|nr:DEAD/DEAH box helicase [Candidatus Methanomethylicia archaeon]MDW7988516.1 DEAD/DEAH box helicase [Nitrososphaerota archaeon]
MSFDLIHKSLKPYIFKKLTPIQELAIPKILTGENLLIISPTGGGKTEAAFIPILSLYLNFRDNFGRIPGIHILYITPLRALNRDILKRMKYWCDKVNVKIDIRHGDTPSSIRRLQLKQPPEILITTPETLQALLPSIGMRNWLKNVKWIVIDEIHNLIKSKRGIQLSIALERLKLISNKFQLILLSATVPNTDYISKFFSGVDSDIKVVIDPSIKSYEFHIEYPIPIQLDFEYSVKLMCTPAIASRIRFMIDLINKTRSTIIFVNCREYAEYISSRLGMAGIDVYSHHSSLSRDVREIIESKFKSGYLKCIVATSSLELGIDVGFVDLILQYLSPRQVSTLIQRVGRSGHFIDRVSRGYIVCNGFDDVLESMVICKMALNNELEDLIVHENALDVLAHQIVGLTLDLNEISIIDMYKTIRNSYPYRNLSFTSFLNVLNYIVDLGLLKISNEFIYSTKRSRKYYYEHLSTIFEEIKFPVKVESTGENLGFLGEDFFSVHTRPGIKLILRGKPWIVSRISDFEVYVNPSSDYMAAIPGWEGEVLPTSRKIALKVGSLRSRIYNMWVNGASIDDVVRNLSLEYPFGFEALRLAVKYFIDYLNMGYPPPTDNNIVIESFDRFIVIHSCNGHGVNKSLAKIISAYLKEKFNVDCIFRVDAYRILFMVSNGIDGKIINEIISNLNLENALKILYLNVDPYIIRHIALKFNAIPKGMYYKTISHLIHLPQIFVNTPIYDEAYRFELIEHFDFNGLKDFIDCLRNNSINIIVLEKSSKPSPLAIPIVEVGDMISLSNEELFSLSILNKIVTLLCVDCLKVWRITVKDISEPIKCINCGSKNISLIKWKIEDFLKVLSKIKSSESLSEDEEALATYCKMSSDLIVLYGRRAIIALAVKGVGPLTAYQILAKMHKSLDELFKDLMYAMKEYMETREFWDEK